MAPKHHAGESEGQPLSKRVRVENEPSETAAAHKSEQPEEIESGSEYESDPEEESMLLRKAEQDLANQTKKLGSAREAGCISRVILNQFMCHRYQVVDLGPRINFIIGHNGSGKSAVLTAITLVLGAKASNTNRGTSLKSFIRQGETKAQITLHLSNRGDEAFQSEIYGDEIIVERTILKEGGGSYKIKSGADGKIVSKRKETLQAILDHFMIQVDNPLNVLNQDAAKKFLNASTSKQKYELFIRGTQLQQLTEEYEEINANIVMSRTLLDKKREDLPELHRLAKSAAKTMKEVKDASNAQQRIDQLQNELAWIYVTEAEEERDAAAASVETEENAIPKYETKIEQIRAQIIEFEQKISQIETEKAERNADLLESKRSELNKLLKERFDQIKAINVEIREVDATVKTLDSTIAQQQQQIDQENLKSLKNTDSSRQEGLELIKRLDKEIESGNGRLADIEQSLEQTNVAGRNANSQSKQLEIEVKQSTSEIERISDLMRQTERAQQNRIFAYGQLAYALKQAVDAEKSWIDKPLGPLGLYVQLKDNAWGSVLEAVLGGSLSSYLVTNRDDERILRQLMTKVRSPAPILRTARDLFDYSSGEPSPEYLTILKVLSFEDEFVKRALINDARIEKSILVEHRRVGDPIMSRARHLRPNVEACYTKDGFKVGAGIGGYGVTPLRLNTGPPRLSGNGDEFMTKLEQELAEHKTKVGTLKARSAGYQEECLASHRQLQALKTEERALKQKIRQAQDKKAALQDELNQNASSDVSALEEVKREMINERQLAYGQAKELIRQREDYLAKMNPLKAERDAVQSKLNNMQEVEEAINQQMTSLVTERVTLKSNLKHYEDSLQKQKSKVIAAKENYEHHEEKVKAIIDQAKKICGSDVVMQPSRSKKKVISELDTLSKLVKSTELRHGDSLEDIEEKCHVATTNYFKAEKQIREHAKSLKVLKAALALRKERWLQFRIHISVRAKMKFLQHLSIRGYKGKLNFNHNTQRLEIQVNVSNESQTQGKMNDAKGLSGGEKSFSTISLLLTLWDAINCPIRCLDEFDVFMDEVNRKVAVHMMIESAKVANDVQYVFITPNSLGSTTFGPECKIVRMQDPERDSGLLGSGRK